MSHILLYKWTVDHSMDSINVTTDLKIIKNESILIDLVMRIELTETILSR